MSNPNELRNARRKVDEAARNLAAIEALPRRVGSVIEWGNGVRWVRIGDDLWEARHRDPEAYQRAADYDETYGPFSSLHVALFPWRKLGRKETREMGR